MTQKMRHRRLGVLALALTLPVVLAAGCSSSSSPSTSASSSSGKISIRMQLSWTPNAEFAGYLVAKALGYYSKAGLNVTILPGGPNVNDLQQLASGAADVTVDRTSALFEATAKGVPIKAIAETNTVPLIWLVGRKSDGITGVSSLKGKRIGIYSADQFIITTMLKNMGINPKDVQLFFQGYNVNGFIAKKYPVAEVYLNSDYVSMQEAGIKASQLTVFKPADYGADIVHGVIISTDKMIQTNPAALRKFVQATLKGWEYSFAHPTQATAIVLAAAGSSGGTKAYELAGLQAMKNVSWPSGAMPPHWGSIPVAVYQQNAKVVQSTGGTGGTPINVANAVDTSIVGG